MEKPSPATAGFNPAKSRRATNLPQTSTAISGPARPKDERRISSLDVTLLSIADARQHLGGVGRSSIYRWLAEGKLEAVRVGRRRLITSRSIRALAGVDG